ncbi:MAG: hypothetical protein OHK93_005541 [Ramalina farinacea]|uniref:Uncharacterized protein n=1 Tax=Ramalina farinacea TaxID=258253 RepID=A0AA43TSQ9_9LECA|nr:hypothetical protein [Ramalina farinacea]
MQFFTLATLLVAGSATALAGPLETRTNPKANEYGSPDCSGPINFGHASAFLPDTISMDTSSHSVYLAGATWHAWTGGNGNTNGDPCSGDDLGALPGECNNLDTAFQGERIACLSR